MKFVTLLATHLETWPFATDVALGYSDGWLYICHPYNSTVGTPALPLPPPPLPSPSGVLQSKAWTPWKVVANDFQLPVGLPLPDPNENLVTDWKQWKEEVLRLAALADSNTPETVDTQEGKVDILCPFSLRAALTASSDRLEELRKQAEAENTKYTDLLRSLNDLGFALHKSSVQSRGW